MDFYEILDQVLAILQSRGRVTYRSNGSSTSTTISSKMATKILQSKAALAGERKQVTVLFCDLANSTCLVESLGPEVMHAVLNGSFELALDEVHRYEGTINQLLGDGFMAHRHL